MKQPEPQKQTSGKRRDLTREEIAQITGKHGFTTNDGNRKWGSILPTKHVVSYYEEGLLSYTFWSTLTYGFHKTFHLWFCDDGFYWRVWSVAEFIAEDIENIFSESSKQVNSVNSMSYDDLRNDPKITYAYLKELFKDFPSEVVPTLMELKELE